MIDNEEVVQAQEETTANPEVQSVEPEIKQEAAPVQETQQESSKEKNLRILRERAERAERERDELLRSSQPKPQEEDDGLGLDNDALAEIKHVRELRKEIKQLKQEVATSHVESAEMRLKAQHSDFDKVVSKENLEALRNEYPELAQTLNNTPDLYVKAKSAYTMIKKLGIGEVEIDENDRDREIAKKNMAKPKPLASISPSQGNSPLSKANAFQNDYSDAALKEAYKEMRQILGKE